MQNMKKIIYIIILFWVAAVMFPACSFLDVEKPGKNDIPKFFSNLEGLQFARQGVYNELYGFFDGYYTKYAEVAGDLVEINVGDDMRDQFDFISKPEDRNSAQNWIWRNGYSAISNANNILKYAPVLKESNPNRAADIDRIYAEALFARAAVYLALCNVYAQPYNYTADASHMGIPVVTRLAGSNEEIPRSPVSAVYKRITDDLTDALAILGEPTAPDTAIEGKEWSYYITSRACKALLARVYLYMGEYELARDCASALIDKMSLTKYENYAAMTQTHYDTEPGVECIFKLSGLGLNGHTMNKFFFGGPTPAPAVISSKLFELVEYPEDVRFSLLESREIIKYRNPVYVQTSSDGLIVIPDTNLIPYGVSVLRLSEMYLIRAEAYYNLNELGKAADDLKAIIGRAIDKAPAEVTLSYATADDLFDILDRERSLEFFGEGHRFFDIIRWKQDLVRSSDTASEVKTLTYPNDKFVLPLPYDETSVNPALIQNPGY